MLACSPGGEAVATLKLGKPAVSVHAKLELYLDEHGSNESRARPKLTLAAAVGPAVQTPDGWTYVVKAAVPSSPVPAKADGDWILSVEAVGARAACSRTMS